MTFSIVAFVPETGEAGVAVASKFLAVGNIVPWVQADVGAVATQALCNASFGPDGLARMGTISAQEALNELIQADPGRNRRQVGLVDRRGLSASHTGTQCQPWAGHKIGQNYACQGNCLAGPGVIESMANAFESGAGDLYQKLFAALAAGDEAGGDRRGRQSAAIKVVRAGAGYQGLGDTVIDLRCDDAAAPIPELARLISVHELYFNSNDCEKLSITGEVEKALREIMQRAVPEQKIPEGWSDEFGAALDAFIGTENLEERFSLEARTIDSRAFEYLRNLYP